MSIEKTFLQRRNRIKNSGYFPETPGKLVYKILENAIFLLEQII
jgi:hypothetical protein